jgi:hypothetical protein
MGQVGTLVGYGETGTGLTGQISGTFGTMLAANNMIDGSYNSQVLGVDFDSPTNPNDSTFGSSTPLPLEGLAAAGDSGGGVFITIGSNTYLAGLNSFTGAPLGGSPISVYGDRNGITRVSSFLPWISQNSDGAVPVPEPSSLALAATGMIAAAAYFWRRRRASL